MRWIKRKEDLKVNGPKAGWKERASFWALVVSQPLLAISCLIGGWLENEIARNLIPNIYSIIAVLLAFHASLQIRQRTKNLRKSWKQQAFDCALDLWPVIFLVAMAQVMTKDISSTVNDPATLKILGYQPSRSAKHVLEWMGSFWTIMLAYVIKYHWDALIAAFERDRDDPPS